MANYVLEALVKLHGVGMKANAVQILELSAAGH